MAGARARPNRRSPRRGILDGRTVRDCRTMNAQGNGDSSWRSSDGRNRRRRSRPVAICLHPLCPLRSRGRNLGHSAWESAMRPRRARPRGILGTAPSCVQPACTAGHGTAGHLQQPQGKPGLRGHLGGCPKGDGAPPNHAHRPAQGTYLAPARLPRAAVADRAERELLQPGTSSVANTRGRLRTALDILPSGR